VIAAFDRRFFAPSAPERIAAVRVLVGLFGTVYVAARVPYILDIAELPRARFEPVGIFAGLGEPLPVWLVRGALLATVLLGVAFTVGWHYRAVAPLYAAALLAAMTYSNSWQHVAHTENLLELHTAMLAAPDPAYGWPLRLLSLLTVVTYVLAGVAKLRHGGSAWVSGDVLRDLIAHDNLRKIVLGDRHSPIGGELVRFGWVFPPLAFVSLLVELGAPVALLRGRVRAAWIAAAWLFHVFVLSLMAITFFYPLSGIAFASMLHPDVLLTRARHRSRRPARTDPALAT
jgi:hypothetical protein